MLFLFIGCIWSGIYLELKNYLIKQKVAEPNFLAQIILYLLSPMILLITLTMRIINKMERILE